jgi:hypothetical protein
MAWSRDRDDSDITNSYADSILEGEVANRRCDQAAWVRRIGR